MSTINLFMAKKQMASCPFNSAHTFEKQKLVFHIARCKDKQKLMPFMTKCQYNPLHYVMKDKLQLHEQYCSDRVKDEEMIKKYHQNFRTVERQRLDETQGERRERMRSRSRQDRQNNREENVKQENQVKHERFEKSETYNDPHFHSTDETTFSDCQQCQNIVRKFKDKIMQNTKIVKLIKKYEKLGSYSIL